jgi:uncharacterized integral membrane protein
MRLFRRPQIDAETREAFQPRLWALVAGLALIVVYVIAFIAENTKRVSIRFVLFTAHTSVIWLIVLSLAIGLVGGLLLSQLERRRRKRRG